MAFSRLLPIALCGLGLLGLLQSAHGSGAQKFEKEKNPNLRTGTSEFNYDKLGAAGPSSWGAISPDFSECAKGQHQSPINLQINQTREAGQQPDVKLNEGVVEYAPSGQNFVLNCVAGVGQPWCSTTTYGADTFHMLQAHFHSPSEHHIEDVTFPLEMHLVHKAQDGNSLLVLGVVFEYSDVKLDAVDALLQAALNQGKGVVDFPALIRPGAELCTYSGSLTTPPCTEGVIWLLSNARLPVTRKQVGTYLEMIGEKQNARPVQGDVVAHPEARCYSNPTFSGGSARNSSHTHSTPTTTSDTGGPHSAGKTTGKTAPTSIAPSENVAPDNTTNSVGGVTTIPPPAAAQGGACFPREASVQLLNGEHVTMGELKIGDEVHIGNGRYSKVYLFSHRDESVVSKHVHITMADQASITLSPGHFLNVNGVLKSADSVVVGDSLDSAQGGQIRVLSVATVAAQGLYNPHTVHGSIAVDGVVTSTYTTAVAVPVAQALLAPVRALFGFGAVGEGNAGSFLKYGRV